MAQTELNKSKLIQIKIDKLNDEYNNNSKIVEEQVNQQSGETSLIRMLANSKNLGDFLRMSNSVSILKKSQQIHFDSQKVLLNSRL